MAFPTGRAPSSAQRIRVAAVQTRPTWGAVGANLERATDLVDEAARRGARVVVLSELAATGYDGTHEIWDLAEPTTGRIGKWLASTAGRLGIYLGCGMPERAGDDCYNAFVWAGPDASILGGARKAVVAERHAFRRGPGWHLLQTSLGSIGTGICADNQRFAHLSRMASLAVDLVAMPHAAPMFAEPSRAVDAIEVAAQHQRMKALPVVYAKALGVPVIFANQVGPVRPIAGIVGTLIHDMGFRLLGLSRIVDSDGQVVAELGGDEGVAIGEVVLDPARKAFHPPAHPRGTVFPVPLIMRALLLPADRALGALSYYIATSERRRRFDANEASR